MALPYNRPYLTGRELACIEDALARRKLSGGGGHYTDLCQQWLRERTGSSHALLTHSCTAALEMSAILADLQPGDEVIMPSYTFTSTANAFVLRGAVPVFVDIRPDTLNIDETKIEAAITSRTKAIVPVHYAGVPCEMDTIMDIADRNQLFVIEDAAQGLLSSYHGRPIGSIGHLATFSFHETKNIISGEGGALIINAPVFCERAEIIWEKGTNRRQFQRGEIDRISWVDLGSSYMPSEILAAFLWAQFEQATDIIRQRLEVWQDYHREFQPAEAAGLLRCPIVPDGCRHNGHIYYLLAPTAAARAELLGHLRKRDIGAVFHYVPLHSAPAGKKFGRPHGPLLTTIEMSARLVRLPLWAGMEPQQLRYIQDAVAEVVDQWQPLPISEESPRGLMRA